MKYRRDVTKGGTYFFTVVTYRRKPIFNSRNNVELLREAFRYVLRNHTFRVDACIVLPDHLHTIWTLPDEDSDYSIRWRLIKSYFSHNFLSQPISDIPESRIHKGEQAIWQRRFWEHLIRDDEDYWKHIDYIHYNPVKHGLVNSPVDWPYSSLLQFVKKGMYPPEWCVGQDLGSIIEMDIE